MSRVQSLLNRIVEYAADANTIKTCCGVLSILSRTEDKKAEIASAGLLLILQAMHTHMANDELLEAACDLLWTLAFNNRSVKANISAHGGVHTLLRCIDAHKTNAELLRSVLGTLSNLSELAENQHHIGIGLPVILAALQLHTRNVDLVAFAFDTLASIIVGHKKNCHTIQQAGAMTFILDMVQKHPTRLDLVKSGCHTLAIMCDLAGMGAAIVQAKGIKPLLSLLAATPLPPDIERILTVLIFRISKEPPVLVQLVHEGLLAILFKGLATSHRTHTTETLLATCHILCQVTRHASEHAMDLTPYLPLPACTSDTLLRVAAEHSTAPALALALFRVLASVAKNPKELPALVNMPALETMLALCTTHGNPPEMLHVTIEVLCRLRRSTIQTHVLKTPEKTLTALLVCIRNFPDDIGLLDQAFAIVMVFVSSERASNPRTVFGFVGAAMRFLSRFSTADWSPHLMIEACKFLLHTMTTKEGVESIVSCGGLAILRKFQHDVAKKAMPPELGHLLHAMCLRLDPSAASHRSSSSNNNSNSSLHAESLPKPTLLPSLSVGTISASTPSPVKDPESDDDNIIPSASVHAMATVEVDDNGGNDEVEDNDDVDDEGDEDCDDADDDDDDDVDAEDDDGDDLEGTPEAPRISTSVPSEKADAVGGTPPEEADPIVRDIATCHPYPQDILSSHRIAAVVTDDQFVYASPSGKHLPKHPLRPLPERYDSPVLAPPGNVLSPTCPWTLEPVASSFADDVEMQLYMEERRQQRVAFLNAPVGQLVYQSSFAAGRVTAGSRVSNRYPYTPVPPSQPFASSLTFESEFESGNLLRAVQIGPYEYDLVLRADLHTAGYTQWFYFAVSNVDTSENYTFHIINLYKPDSLFNAGLLPVVYSVKDAATMGMGWRRRGHRVCYYNNPWPLPSKSDDPASTSCYHTLTFSLDFPHRADTFLIAHSYPYTLADHAWHLRQPQFQSPSVVRRSVLCETQGRLDCDLLTITDFAYPAQERLDIVLTARVHPGEPQASWIMRGTLDFLVSDAVEARLLRRLFVFHVIPVLNPDGVFFGNNRCGLSACDLNRQWKTPCRVLHPTIYYAKQLIESLAVVFYCDFHGHSRKMNVFMYGCDSKKHANPIARYYPKLLAAAGHRYVCYDACNFQVNRGREATARVVVGRDLGVANSFTLEASFCGADMGVLAKMHYNVRHLLDLGLVVGQTLLDYAVPMPMDRQPLLEWVQQSDGHPSLYTYIAAQYAQKETLWSVIPLHLTRTKKKSKRAKPTAKRKLKLKPTPPPPVVAQPQLVPPKSKVLKTKRVALPPPKASDKLKKELKTGLLKDAMPPPLALKKFAPLEAKTKLTTHKRCDTPPPPKTPKSGGDDADNNHSDVLRVGKRSTLGYRRLGLSSPASCKDGSEDDARRSRRISFPTVMK
ncbi:metalloprotease family M14A [Achlya hypogyna]|uniref:tubulin-glutamate carboxypeptidase n=1 Tax=Achlya hypogyna TaxID=1202772 RepID=A0A1V9YMR1_ACHHY|nr:metalloprotease family M14A [Achlya hypogyna]